MIANLEKFHAVIVRKDGQTKSSQGHKIKSGETVQIFGLTLDNELDPCQITLHT